MPTALITGCDTGVGREFVIQYARAGWNVVATYHDLSNMMDTGEYDGDVIHHQLDVTLPDQFKALRQAVGSTPIDVLLSNAGVGLEKSKLGNVDHDFVLLMFRTNALGALRLVETFVDNVASSTMRRIAVVSSRMGSVANNLTGGHYGYRASKAALNAMMRSAAIDLAAQGISVIVMHPGAVSVPSAPDSPVGVEESVEGMRILIERLGPHETGQFHRFDGEPIAW